MAFGYGAFGCGPVAAPVGPVVGGVSTIGMILVLFILLVIIVRVCVW